MKQIIYLGGKKAREYDGVDKPKSREYYGGFPNGQSGDRDYPKAMLSYKAHISTLPVVDVIGDCDWKEGEVKTEGVDYEMGWFVKTDSYQGEGGRAFKTLKEAEAKYSEWAKYDGQLQSKAYTPKPVIVPIPKKQEGESQKSMLEEIESVYLNDGTGPMFDYIEDNFILTRKS